MQEDIHAIAVGQHVIKSDVVGALGSDGLEVWWYVISYREELFDELTCL